MRAKEVDFELFFGLCVGYKFTDPSETGACIVYEDVYPAECTKDLLDGIRCHLGSGVGNI